MDAGHKTIPPVAASETAANAAPTGVETIASASVNGGVGSTPRSPDLGVSHAPTSEIEVDGASKVRLVVGVLTAGRHVDRRQAVRETWGSDPRCDPTSMP